MDRVRSRAAAAAGASSRVPTERQQAAYCTIVDLLGDVVHRIKIPDIQQLQAPRPNTY